MELQQARDADFSDPVGRYRGSDPAVVLTGLAEGKHYFRIRKVAADPQPWSESLLVSVEFFPRERLFLFLVVGAVVVLATIGSIVAGFVSSRRRERGKQK